MNRRLHALRDAPCGNELRKKTLFYLHIYTMTLHKTALDRDASNVAAPSTPSKRGAFTRRSRTSVVTANSRVNYKV